MRDETDYLKFQTRGDILEVKLMDSSYHTFFKARVNINDEKEMAMLIDNLKEKGIIFPIVESSWF